MLVRSKQKKTKEGERRGGESKLKRERDGEDDELEREREGDDELVG